MTAFPRRGKVERELPRRKTSLAACGRRHTRRHNDTPALNMFSLDVNNVVGVMESQNEVVAFLYDEVTDSEIEEMTKELEQMENVQSVRFISKEEGLTQWLDTLGEDGELLESFYEDNFVPNSYSIKVK